jgi:hypothetical protein
VRRLTHLRVRNRSVAAGPSSAVETAAGNSRSPPARTGRHGRVRRLTHLRVRNRSVAAGPSSAVETAAGNSRSPPARTGRHGCVRRPPAPARPQREALSGRGVTAAAARAAASGFEQSAARFFGPAIDGAGGRDCAAGPQNDRRGRARSCPRPRPSVIPKERRGTPSGTATPCARLRNLPSECSWPDIALHTRGHNPRRRIS